MDLKEKLLELLKKSPTMRNMDKQQRKLRIEAMLTSDDEAIKKFIEIFEDETKEINKIENEFEQGADEVENLIKQAKQLDDKTNKLFIKEKEEISKSTDRKEAEKLLDELEDAA